MNHLILEFHLRTFPLCFQWPWGGKEALRAPGRDPVLLLASASVHGASRRRCDSPYLGPTGSQWVFDVFGWVNYQLSLHTWSLSIVSPIDKTRRNHHSLSLTNLTINCDHPNIDKCPRETRVFPRPCKPTPWVPCWVKNRPVPFLL
jgi:hypothetical protein